MNILDQLTRDEGMRLTPYRDSVGKLTIGIGRNLDDVGISRDEAQYLLANDVKNATDRLTEAFPWVAGLDDVRRAVLVNMTFNMGICGLSTFRNTLQLIKDGRYSDASQEMLKSKWARQVGMRANRLAIQLESGTWQ